MKRTLDVGKVEAALKRAARTAASGSRELRSGRILVNRSGPSKQRDEGDAGKRPTRKH